MTQNVQSLLSQLREAITNNNFLRSIELSEEVYKLQMGHDLPEDSVCYIVRLLHQASRKQVNVYDSIKQILLSQ